MRTHFLRMGQYNHWANERLYQAVSGFDDVQLTAENGAYFDSIFGTLTHILIADQIWMYRLSKEGPNPTDLRHRPFESLEDLWVARQAMDQRILSFLEELDDTLLAKPVRYENTRGEPHELPRNIILTHLFNHQTHHRGQVHHMLSVEGVEPPPLDLLYFVLPAA